MIRPSYLVRAGGVAPVSPPLMSHDSEYRVCVLNTKQSPRSRNPRCLFASTAAGNDPMTEKRR